MIRMSRSIVPTLAWRFLLSRVSGGFLSFIAWIAVLGVLLGVTALIVVTSVVNGYESELGRAISSLNGDVVLYSRGEPIQDPEKIEEKIKSLLPEGQVLESLTSSFIMQLMVSGPDAVSGAVLEGIDVEREKKVTALSKRIVTGRMPETDYEVVLGNALAEKIGAIEGSEVRVSVPYIGDGKDSSSNTQGPKAFNFRVVGRVQLGMYDYDSKYFFARLEGVQKALNHPGRVTSFKLKLKEGQSAKAAADKLSEAFGFPFRAKDWSAFNKNLFAAIQLEKAVLSILLTAIIMVAAFNVISTLMMMLHDKEKEIAILKAMGFSPKQAFRLFLIMGVGIGMVGVALGVGFGFFVNEVIDQTHLISIPPQIYNLDHLPVLTRWREVIAIAGTALFIVVGATLFPAIKVARQSPLEGIRYG